MEILEDIWEKVVVPSPTIAASKIELGKDADYKPFKCYKQLVETKVSSAKLKCCLENGVFSTTSSFHSPPAPAVFFWPLQS